MSIHSKVILDKMYIHIRRIIWICRHFFNLLPLPTPCPLRTPPTPQNADIGSTLNVPAHWMKNYTFCRRWRSVSRAVSVSRRHIKFMAVSMLLLPKEQQWRFHLLRANRRNRLCGTSRQLDSGNKHVHVHWSETVSFRKTGPLEDFVLLICKPEWHGPNDWDHAFSRACSESPPEVSGAGFRDNWDVTWLSTRIHS